MSFAEPTLITGREAARAIAVDLEQQAAEAERLLRKVVILACEHRLGLVLSEHAQDALEFLCRDST